MYITNKPVQFYLYLTLLLYVVIYSAFLYSCDFLPYVLDNNETYSSLVHAYNMYFGDWSQSFGLTDEAFSPDPAAHPMIHTHQGNWPRIFAYILFALGFRGAESQVVIHVFTIGTLGIWLMYRYFAKITHYHFAFIACLVFMTDYMLFAQWQAVTYRVWHCFFVFASLNCMHEIDGKDKRWKWFFWASFAALYYWELVFAFYVSVWSLGYYCLLVKGNIRKTLKCGVLLAASGLCGLGILFTQLSLFIGFKNAVQDYYLTFFARNFSGDPDAFKNILQEFYKDKDIAFFYNISDGNGYKTLEKFKKSIFYHGFQIHTPAFSLLAIFAFVGLAINTLKNKINIKFAAINVSTLKAILATFVSLTICMGFLLYSNSFLGINSKNPSYEPWSLISLISLPFIGMFLSILIYKSTFSNINHVNLKDLIFVNIFLIFCSFMIASQPYLYQEQYSEIWFNSLTVNISPNVWILACIFVILACIINMLVKVDVQFYSINYKGLRNFFVSALVAYGTIYILSPGYLYSGYLTRTAPFIVFFIDVILALLFWFVFKAVYYQIRLCYAYKYLLQPKIIPISNRNMFIYLPKVSLAVFGALIFILLTYHWLHTQYTYYNLFPATSLSFIKNLRLSGLHNSSIVTNQYSLPFAYESKNWAYSAGTFGTEGLTFTGNRYVMNINYDYLWYKNKLSFDPYKYPEHFVCFIPNSFDSVVSELKNYGDVYRLCSRNRLVMHAKLAENFSKKDTRFRHKIILSDKTNRDKWSIIKFDWEFPPYFAKQKGKNNYFDVQYNRYDRLLSLKYAFIQQDNVPEEGTHFLIYMRNKNNEKILVADQIATNGYLDVKLKNDLQSKLEIIAVPYTKSKSGAKVSEVFEIEKL